MERRKVMHLIVHFEVTIVLEGNGKCGDIMTLFKPISRNKIVLRIELSSFKLSYPHTKVLRTTFLVIELLLLITTIAFLD